MEKKKINILNIVDGKTMGVLALMFLIAFLFWDTPLIYPVKLFVVILHEFSHGLVAILTGGQIERIEIDYRVGGVCYFRGGNLFLTASAGYLGSIFWGGLILILAAKTKYDNLMGIIIGAFLIILSILYVRNMFGFVFTLLFGVFLIIISYKAGNYILDLLMKFLGMTSCLYAIIDIKEDLISRTNIGSDADYIAQSLGWQKLSVFIGIFWIFIALLSFCIFLFIAGKNDGQKKN
jgi:hypothetical protein